MSTHQPLTRSKAGLLSSMEIGLVHFNISLNSSPLFFSFSFFSPWYCAIYKCYNPESGSDSSLSHPTSISWPVTWEGQLIVFPSLLLFLVIPGSLPKDKENVPLLLYGIHVRERNQCLTKKKERDKN